VTADVTTTISTCWLVTLTDATVLGFTDHDTDLTVGAQLYKASVGYTPSAIQNTTELSPDNMDLMGIIDDAGIKEADLRAGKYDYATIRIFTVDWDDLPSGEIETKVKGKLGAVSLKQGLFNAELNSLASLFSSNVGEAYSTLCPADLGDSRCTVNLAPDTWVLSTAYIVGDQVSPVTYNGRTFVCTTAGTSHTTEPTWDTDIGDTTSDNTVVWTAQNAKTKELTVTGVTDNLTFFDAAQDDADDYFVGGLCTWVTGDNAGYRMDIKGYLLSGGAFVLYEPMPFDIEIGDTALVTTGCDKTNGTCKTTFNNLNNFRAFPHIPGIQKLLG